MAWPIDSRPVWINRRMLRQEHDRQRLAEEEEFGRRRAARTAKCRDERRNMLRQSDDAEEQLAHHYEKAAIHSRMELSRLAAVFRRKAAEERKAIELKVQQREHAVLEQYESSKHQPSSQNAKDQADRRVVGAAA